MIEQKPFHLQTYLQLMAYDALVRVETSELVRGSEAGILHALLVLKLIAAKLATGELHPRPL